MQLFLCFIGLNMPLNPNTIKSYKILRKLSPKHAAHGVAQSTYPNYRHGKACLSKQPPWRAAGDPRLARGRSRVWAPGPARFFFPHPPFLPPSGDSFFRTFPTNPAKVLGLIHVIHSYPHHPIDERYQMLMLLFTSMELQLGIFRFFPVIKITLIHQVRMAKASLHTRIVRTRAHLFPHVWTQQELEHHKLELHCWWHH